MKIARFLSTVFVGTALFFGSAFGQDATPPKDQIIAVVGGKLVTVDALVNPTAQIVGLDPTVTPKEMVILQGGISDSAKHFQTASKVVWTVSVNDKPLRTFRDMDGNLMFVTPDLNGSILKVVLTAEVTYKVGSDSLVKQTITTGQAVIGTPQPPTPPIPPTPVPPTPPTPPPFVPAGFLNLTKIAHDNFPAKVDPLKRTGFAKQLSTNARTVAQRVVDGKYPTTNGSDFAKAVFADLKALDVDVVKFVGLTSEDMADLNKGISEVIFKAFTNGELTTTGQWQSALVAVADGWELIQ